MKFRCNLDAILMQFHATVDAADAGGHQGEDDQGQYGPDQPAGLTPP